jgi:hypothetical protein
MDIDVLQPQAARVTRRDVQKAYEDDRRNVLQERAN